MFNAYIFLFQYFKHKYGTMGIWLAGNSDHRSNLINVLFLLWPISCWCWILQQELKISKSWQVSIGKLITCILTRIKMNSHKIRYPKISALYQFEASLGLFLIFKVPLSTNQVFFKQTLLQSAIRKSKTKLNNQIWIYLNAFHIDAFHF